MRYLFTLPAVHGASVVRVDTASGSNTPADIVTREGNRSIPGGVMRSAADGSLPQVKGPDGVTTLYVKELDYSGSTVTSTTTVTGVDPNPGTVVHDFPFAEDPSVWGLIAGNMNPEEASNSGTAFVSGTLHRFRLRVDRSAPAGARTLRLWKSAAASGLTLAKWAVTDRASGTVLNTTASDHANLNSGTGPYNIGVGSWEAVEDRELYVWFVCVGTTGPAFSRADNAIAHNLNQSGGDIEWATNGTGFSDMPATPDPTANVAAYGLAVGVWLS